MVILHRPMPITDRGRPAIAGRLLRRPRSRGRATMVRPFARRQGAPDSPDRGARCASPSNIPELCEVGARRRCGLDGGFRTHWIPSQPARVRLEGAVRIIEFGLRIRDFGGQGIFQPFDAGSLLSLARARCRQPGRALAAARARPVQCVVSPGGAASVRLTTRLTVSPGSGRLPGGRVLSRRRPSTPSCMNRSCQRQTTGFDRPERRTISSVPQSSAVARITRARAECF